VKSLVLTIVVSAGVGGVVSFVVSGLLKSATTSWNRRRAAVRAEKDLLSSGDHLAIQSAGVLRLGSATGSTMVSVAVAPAVSFSEDAKLDPDAVSAWVESLDPMFVTYRQHSDPTN
jgi:hypothetical protein